MVRAWLMDESDEDQRLEHQRSPPVPISLEDIKAKTGVLYCKIDPEHEMDKLEKLRKERGYSYEDVIEICPEKLSDYENKLKTFYKEHLHTDEEIRFVLGGSGYFDVRQDNEEWIRIAMDVGDLIVLPAGIYHRFTLDSKNYIKAMRLFVGEPVWTPHFRPCDDMAPRRTYLAQQKEGFHTLKDLL